MNITKGTVLYRVDAYDGRVSLQRHIVTSAGERQFTVHSARIEQRDAHTNINGFRTTPDAAYDAAVKSADRHARVMADRYGRAVVNVTALAEQRHAVLNPTVITAGA